MKPEIFPGLYKYNSREFLRVLKRERMLKMEHITKVVSEHLDVEITKVMSDIRKREFVMARHISIYFTYNLTAFKLKEIGKYFNRHHATVLYSVEAVEDQIKTNRYYREKVHDIYEILNPRENNELIEQQK